MKSNHQTPKMTKTLEDVMQEINRYHVRIKKTDKISNNKILYSVINELIKRMRKNDNLFDNMKPTLKFMGSFFEGLRVGQPTEYDLNVVLRIPVDYKKIMLDAKSAPDGCTHIFLPSEFRRLSKTSAMGEKGFKRTQLWCDPLYRMSVQKIRSWMQSVLDIVLKTLPTENGKKILQCNNKYYHLTCKMSGPAVTITIYGIDIKDKIDVDLVPTFGFELPKKVENTAVLFDKVALTKVRQYFVVPKPINDSYAWRVSFPFQEKKILCNKNNMKSSLKLLKLFRDSQGFKGLESYFIKTLFLWEIYTMDENKKEFWRRNSLSYLVLYMLKILLNSLHERRIPNFWCPSHNLLENVHPETVLNWLNRISFILNDITAECNDNPNVLFEYFTNKNNLSK